jgi:SAM-dependent methyltransferase
MTKKPLGSRLFVDSMTNLLITFQIAVSDSIFCHRTKIKPTPAGRILKYPALAYGRMARKGAAKRQDLLFQRFVRLHGLHYGPGGRGYQGVAARTREERLSRYQSQVPRLQDFVDTFPDLLNYRNGDLFADLGCGTGQNIRFLAERYPQSAIIGTDMSADAIDLITECEQHSELQLSVGDLRDEAFLDEVLSTPVDHIVLSHVFALIFGSSAEETRLLRQRFIDRMVSATRKSVVILDNFGARDQMKISIEQKQRASVSDDVMSYFSRHEEGRTLMAYSSRTQAVMFVKN